MNHSGLVPFLAILAGSMAAALVAPTHTTRSRNARSRRPSRTQMDLSLSNPRIRADKHSRSA
jgi:hypothetical protein